MTIMSVPASRHTSGFSIQSILGDVDNKTIKDNSESKTFDKKRKNFNHENQDCSSCYLNKQDGTEPSRSQLYFGHADGLKNNSLIQKIQYAHYGHLLSHEYLSRTQEEFRNFWHRGAEESSNPYFLPLRLPHNYHQRSGQSANNDLLFSHLRKPKRVRTAFSPSQLLRLEHAFEKNHYVVGQERKELAAGLALSETQVKVWFQNRRTKHKRIKAEDEMTRSLARTLEERDSKDLRQYDTSDSESDIDV